MSLDRLVGKLVDGRRLLGEFKSRDSVAENLKRLANIACEWIRIWKPAQMSTSYVKLHRDLNLASYKLIERIDEYCQKRYGADATQEPSPTNVSRDQTPSSPEQRQSAFQPYDSRRMSRPSQERSASASPNTFLTGESCHSQSNNEQNMKYSSPSQMLAGTFARSDQVQKIEMMAERKEPVMSSDSESEQLVAKVRPPTMGAKSALDLLNGSGTKNSIMVNKTAEFSDQFISKNAYGSGFGQRF